ncbi:MAG: hypothetical protein HY226_06365 [Candidatus Vogelbacteria bacterium]|nr:hypothetical protein [Candidatus Vogelbacteria bacterium]
MVNMNFKFSKDIVVLDFEFTNKDASKAVPIQLGAIRLDRETLEEKDNFLSYIAADLTNASPEALSVTGINEATLSGAPSAAEVGKMFFDKFGTDIILSSWVSSGDLVMFRHIMDSAKLDATKFDYHWFDIWPPTYLYLIKGGYVGSLRSEAMFGALGFSARGRHDALEDCRHAAQALRIICK